MLRGVCEIEVGAQQNEIVPDAELPDECVDGTDLHTCPTAQIPEPCGGNVVLAIGLDQCQRGKSLDDLAACFCARKSLQQFLQDDACGDDKVCSGQSVLECLYLWQFNLDIPSESERPDARVDEERHLRDRSALWSYD